MRIEFNFGTSVLTLPADVKKYISGAGKNELAVLVAVAGGGEKDVSEVASLSGAVRALLKSTSPQPERRRASLPKHRLRSHMR